jgi:N-methylhydantoinase B
VNHSNGKIAPIEIIESEYPVRLRRFALIPDSAGAGEFRGGLGFVREYEALAPELRFSLRSTKHAIAPRGIAGGAPARGGRCVAYADSSAARELPTRYADLPISSGDVIRLETPGGGGNGDPLRRDPARVLDDVLDGYVSEAAAAARYGVVLRADASGARSVDLVATDARRRAAAKGEARVDV